MERFRDLIVGRNLKNSLDVILPNTPLPPVTPPPSSSTPPTPVSLHPITRYISFFALAKTQWRRLLGPQRDSSSSSSLHTTFPILTTLSISLPSIQAVQQCPAAPPDVRIFLVILPQLLGIQSIFLVSVTFLVTFSICIPLLLSVLPLPFVKLLGSIPVGLKEAIPPRSSFVIEIKSPIAQNV